MVKACQRVETQQRSEGWRPTADATTKIALPAAARAVRQSYQVEEGIVAGTSRPPSTEDAFLLHAREIGQRVPDPLDLRQR